MRTCGDGGGVGGVVGVVAGDVAATVCPFTLFALLTAAAAGGRASAHTDILHDMWRASTRRPLTHQTHCLNRAQQLHRNTQKSMNQCLLLSLVACRLLRVSCFLLPVAFYLLLYSVWLNSAHLRTCSRLSQPQLTHQTTHRQSNLYLRRCDYNSLLNTLSNVVFKCRQRIWSSKAMTIPNYTFQDMQGEEQLRSIYIKFVALRNSKTLWVCLRYSLNLSN